MTRLLETPSPKAPVSELADHAELVCWQRRTISTTELGNCLGRLVDNDYSRDGVPEEEAVEDTVHDVMSEIHRRNGACRNGYPFKVAENGYTLVAVPPEQCHKFLLYRYFLLATRLKMDTNRQHAEIDGALLFEEVAADIARNYFGCRAEALVFGTSSNISAFDKKVTQLCDQMDLPYRFKNRDEEPTVAKDGKLDIVVWKKFADKRDSMLIAFGQCKTGTSFRNQVSELNPGAFCDKWLDTSPAATPVRLFLVTEAVAKRWYTTARDAGLLFDRCRLIDYADDVSAKVLRRVEAWTKAAAIASTLSDD